MNFDSTTISLIITSSIVGFAIGYIVRSHVTHNNTNIIEMLEDDIIQLEQRQKELEDRTTHMTHVVAQPV